MERWEIMARLVGRAFVIIIGIIIVLYLRRVWARKEQSSPRERGKYLVVPSRAKFIIFNIQLMIVFY